MPKTYTTVQGDMWDGVAYKCYGSEAGMNVLMEANRQYNGMVVFPAGITLEVPEYAAPAANKLPPWRR